MPANVPYSLVHAEVLVGLFTCVFVKDSEKSNLRDLDICQVKTGLSGRFGNKGSIVARMVIDDTSVCFANCHLAAGQSHVRQRNKDLIEILDSGDALPAVAEFAPNACSSSAVVLCLTWCADLPPFPRHWWWRVSAPSHKIWLALMTE